MPRHQDAKRWVWLTLALSSITIAAIVFAAWELIENRFFRYANYLTLHYLYITRGLASSLLLAFWAAWFVLRQRRRAEDDLRRSRERMFELEKLASMGKMAAGTAHHLNSPLAALLLRVQLMRERLPEDAPAEDLIRLEEGLKFCRHFVQRLLEFTRTHPVQKQNLDLGAAVDSVAGFFSPVIQTRRVSLVSDTSQATGCQVYADRNLLETILLTLLSNSLDAVPPGGEIRIHCAPAVSGHIAIEIGDNGIGIAPADLQRVFEPFFTTKEPGKGTGLGLAIARQLVLEHGGSIRLDSQPGVGTTARIELPLVEAAL